MSKEERSDKAESTNVVNDTMHDENFTSFMVLYDLTNENI